jgi:hypothetical protein
LLFYVIPLLTGKPGNSKTGGTNAKATVNLPLLPDLRPKFFYFLQF